MAKDGTVYFRTSSFADYGKLSHKNLDELQSGFRELKVTGEDDKEDPSDFVLWKPKKEGEPYWESPWCQGCLLYTSVFQPLPYVKTFYYLDVNFYRYFIGREDQSVNEKVMIGRIDQQIRVTKLMLGYYHESKIFSWKLRHYMVRYLAKLPAENF